MSTATTTRKSAKIIAVDPAYQALIDRHPLRPIRTEADYDRAAAMLNTLVLRDLTPGEDDYLDVLTGLVEAYDDVHYPVPAEDRTPLERVKSLMESSGMTSSQLGDIIQSRPAFSMFLSGARAELSKPQIRRLARHFRLDAGYFF